MNRLHSEIIDDIVVISVEINHCKLIHFKCFFVRNVILCYFIIMIHERFLASLIFFVMLSREFIANVTSKFTSIIPIPFVQCNVSEF